MSTDSISPQFINVNQITGVTPSLNTGVRDAGTQRVTIATNDLVPVTGTLTAVTSITNVVHIDDNAGSLTVDGTVTATPLASGTASGTLNAVNATVSLDISKYPGCSLTVTVSAYTGTIISEVSTDSGVSWTQCFFADVITGALGNSLGFGASTGTFAEVFTLFAGVTNVRLRCTAFTSGTATGLLTATQCIAGIQTVIPVPSTLVVTSTAATGVGVTATLPAIAGQYHKINNIEIIKYFTAANAASATPLIVTTTNLPGSLAFSFGQPLGTIGTTEVRSYTYSTPLRSSAVNTNTTIVCPATTGIIWRVTVYYGSL